MIHVLPIRARTRAHALRRRLRPSLLPILQTAAAAVAAWYLAVLVLPSDAPTFASIAAVICLGATYGQRPQRAVELIGGVLLGIVVAELLLQLIDRGPLQLGLLVVLAMSAAVLLRGGELFVNEAAISAIILVSLPPASGGFADRILEGAIGGAVALAVSSLLFPPHPVVMVGRIAQRLFGNLAGTLDAIADALTAGDADRAERALAQARALDADVAALADALAVARDTARFAPPRRAQRALLRRYEATMPQLDFAVRNTRVLARSALRYSRARLPAPDGLPEALRQLVAAVWALGAQYEEPERAAEPRRLALDAATLAREIFEREPDLAVTEVVAQVRAVAVDLVRAAELLGEPLTEGPEPGELPTDELLLRDAV